MLRARRYDSIAELVADAKDRCVALRLPYGHHEVDEAVAAMRERVHRELRPTEVVSLPDRATVGAAEPTPAPGLTREEATAWLARIGAMVKAVPAAPKVIPNARPLTAREADKRAALRVLAQAIRDQAQRCEDVEQPPPPEDAAE